ncbi:MAG: hypothetical protein WC554_13560 [Clostridia bacterium]
MKEFRKNEEGKLICEECGRICKSQISLSKHLASHKITLKEYYDKWLKEGNEGLCDICGNETKFRGSNRFYYKTCSKECNQKHFKKICLERYGATSPFGSKLFKEKRIKTCLNKYGVEHPSQSNIVKEKSKQTCLEKYGVENTFQSAEKKEKMKQTWIKKYGVDNPNRNKAVRQKIKDTCIEKFGTEYALQNKEIREKGKVTIKEKYGVDHQSQNEGIHFRQMNSGKKIKIYKNTKLWYQGSFELDFLNEYYDIFSNEIKRGPTIKYYFEEGYHNYFSDFIIPSLNLVIEIKNSHKAETDKIVIEAKKQGTLAKGFNYIMIVNKDYNEFESLLSNHGTSNL